MKKIIVLIGCLYSYSCTLYSMDLTQSPLPHALNAFMQCGSLAIAAQTNNLFNHNGALHAEEERFRYAMHLCIGFASPIAQCLARTREGNYYCLQPQYYDAIAAVAGIIQLFNLAYMRYITKHKEDIQVHITSKIKIPQEILTQEVCGICHLTPSQQVVNPCNIAEHIFCIDCLKQWLKSENGKQQEPCCLLCMQEITPENEKVSIRFEHKAPTIKEVFKELYFLKGLGVIFLTGYLSYFITQLF